MSRQIELQDDTLVIRFTGLTGVAALKHQLEIPYSAIQKVSIEDIEMPLFTFRIGTSGFGIREGRFLVDGRWCFLSYENNEHVIVLELEEHEYWKVIFQADDPESVVQSIKEKSSQLSRT
ncbi:hypothetical protein [Paenibacillus cremeus]|uniref:Bacterial Pleckstrin homology domain-containing protein n=1 Tax=Paenibacillus cremeus TaxID=2163881 RepID=A0A559K8I3_9BACL|nr:hypothetical protein [Paenibacillus cremeus]TVY08445.1 hypothetical protein FPZ49_18590 [Paenibacillus cremeus]